MPYGSLNRAWETGTYSRARGGCHVPAIPGRGVTSLVLMVCEIGAPKAQGSRTLGSHTTVSRRALVLPDVPTSLGTCLVMLWYTVSHTLSTS